jgi:hypothetical protein
MTARQDQLKIVEHYEKAYLLRTGKACPPINWKREGMLIKRGLQKADLGGIMRLIEFHMANPTSQNLTLQYILSDQVFNKYIDKTKLDPTVFF